MATKLRNILRCYAIGMGIKETSHLFDVSRNTVRKYFRMFQDCGLTPKELTAMSDHHLYDMFSSGNIRHQEPSERYTQLEALLPEYAARLSRKGVTKKSIYEEYKQKYPDGYARSCFCQHLRQYMHQVRIIGHVEHHAGDQMYIDFAGDRLQVADTSTGELKNVEVFVAILPCSHYTYCEAVWSQRKEDLISACENALHFYGGAPLAIVPDNLKAAVKQSNRHEPVINDDFAAFAEHYECAVFPARVRRPTDKALVENAVKLLYRSVYQDIDGFIFDSLASLNEAIWRFLENFNNQKMSGRKNSRRELFEAMEADYLRPLPSLRYHLKERRSLTVQRNGYITLFKHHYSLPKEYMGKRVDVVYDNETVQIYHGLKLVTTHFRDDTPNAFSEKSSHGLPTRRGSYESEIEEIYAKAGELDNIVLNYLKEIENTMKYLPNAVRSCRGILSLEKKYGQHRLIAACACAANMHRYSYQDVVDVLKNGDDIIFMPDPETNADPDEEIATFVACKNVRGKDYYSKNKSLKSKKHE